MARPVGNINQAIFNSLIRANAFFRYWINTAVTLPDVTKTLYHFITFIA